ncbi:MAG: hypothetical protein JW774_02055, partial [Candidatus Aureabacteria bacterium]|nr:hypothetical protein [Candidatus Auribacterota bacterium]
SVKESCPKTMQNINQHAIRKNREVFFLSIRTPKIKNINPVPHEALSNCIEKGICLAKCRPAKRRIKSLNAND